MKTKRAAIYARVSMDENRQDPETQLRELRDFAERRGFEVVGKYIDHGSGKTEERANYKRLLEDARRRRLDVVLVWRYDRFARSTVALVNAPAASPSAASTARAARRSLHLVMLRAPARASVSSSRWSRPSRSLTRDAPILCSARSSSLPRKGAIMGCSEPERRQAFPRNR